MITRLLDRLRPGGLLAVGNAAVNPTSFWFAEFLLDWSLIYRTRQEMFELAEDIPNVASADVHLEASEAYHFLLLRKSAERNPACAVITADLPRGDARLAL